MINNSFASSYGVIGDAGHWNVNAQKVRDSILRSGIKKLILPGDNLYDTNLEYQDVWANWTNVGLKPHVVALGNHHKSIEAELAFFKMPKSYYSIVEENIRFIILDSETLTNLDEQFTFLKNELENSTETFNILVFHHPSATVSYRHGWKEREAFHLKILPLLLKYQNRIQLIINGHDHIASLFSFGMIPSLVSGAVFESIPAPVFEYERFDGISIKTRWANTEGFYWARLDFDSKNKRIWVNFVRSDLDEVSCSILLLPGSILRRSNCFKKGATFIDVPPM